MSKKRVGINLDHKVWELSKELAHDKRESLSGYIEGLITGRLGENEKGSTNQIKEASQLDRIESKLDLLIPTEVTVLSDRVFEPGEVVEVDDLDEAILKAGQLRLEEKQRKIAELKKELGSTIHFSPQPKNKDKKGGK